MSIKNKKMMVQVQYFYASAPATAEAGGIMFSGCPALMSVQTFHSYNHKAVIPVKDL